jgi:putative membrane protein
MNVWRVMMRLAFFGSITMSGILFAQGHNVCHDGWWGYHSFGLGGILMWLVPIILIGLLVYFIFQKHGAFKGDSTRETPMDIIKKRYARGEITKEEFERMKEELR